MKKYNRPTIEALALETIDVIAASGTEDAVAALENLGVERSDIETFTKNVADMKNSWSW